MSIRESQKTFHNAVTQIGNGTEYDVSRIADSNSVMAISTNAVVAKTITFQGKSQAGDWVDIKCINRTTGNTAISSTGTSAEIWEMSLNGLRAVRVVLSALTLGEGLTFSAYGEVIS